MVQNQEKTALEMIRSEMGIPGDQVAISGLSGPSTAYMAVKLCEVISARILNLIEGPPLMARLSQLTHQPFFAPLYESKMLRYIIRNYRCSF